ncbi:hypothetical protein NM688_g7718 [Phlebia brevispora]|uniref:Uncharacterized protein n=1 Tax=Phlebia brevispora TaxID=194682 RepID=A0ACC1S271_9APHY|nr:hypothetical protein NM688_g7718 [Phlebia brevispora]
MSLNEAATLHTIEAPTSDGIRAGSSTFVCATTTIAVLQVEKNRDSVHNEEHGRSISELPNSFTLPDSYSDRLTRLRLVSSFCPSVMCCSRCGDNTATVMSDLGVFNVRSNTLSPAREVTSRFSNMSSPNVSASALPAN